MHIVEVREAAEESDRLVLPHFAPGDYVDEMVVS